MGSSQISDEDIEKAFPSFEFTHWRFGKTNATCKKCGMVTSFNYTRFQPSIYLELHEIKHLLSEKMKA